MCNCGSSKSPYVFNGLSLAKGMPVLKTVRPKVHTKSIPQVVKQGFSGNFLTIINRK
jgi:hypothetical protein